MFIVISILFVVLMCLGMWNYRGHIDTRDVLEGLRTVMSVSIFVALAFILKVLMDIQLILKAVE